MRKWNKLPALLLAGVMALGLTTAALAADVTYPDVAGTWSEEYVKRMTELELMEGRSAGAFAPNENMTRPSAGRTPSMTWPGTPPIGTR